MKKTTLFLLTAALLLGLTACTNSTDETSPEKGKRTIEFRVTNFQQVSLDEVTRATAATNLAHLDMAVYDAETNALVCKTQMGKDDEGYGSFSATLDYGTYNVVLLGYDGTHVADMTDPTEICFNEDYVPNFFYKALPLTVSATSENTQNVVLKRGVAAFRLKHEGYIPTTLRTISVTGIGGGDRFNALTGYAKNTRNRDLNYNVASLAGGESFTLTYFTFLPSEEATMNFVIRATDTANKELQTRTFNDVPMKINQMSIYSGQFFGSGNQTLGFSLTLESDEWDEENQTF